MGRHTAPNIIPAWLSGHMLTDGEETFSREFFTSNALATTSGQVRLSYFTARRTEPVTSFRILSGSTAAGATPTLTRLGLYSIAANESGTLIAATDPTDLTIFATANTVYTRNALVPGQKIAGNRYAFGFIVISAAAMPSICGHGLGGGGEPAMGPRMTGAISGQTDLPASFVVGSLVSSGNRPYGVMIP